MDCSNRTEPDRTEDRRSAEEPDREAQELLAPGALRPVDGGLPPEDRGDDLAGARDARDGDPPVALPGQTEGLLDEAVDLRGVLVRGDLIEIVEGDAGEPDRLLREPADEPAVLLLGLHRRRREGRTLVEAGLDLAEQRERVVVVEERAPRGETVGHPLLPDLGGGGLLRVDGRVGGLLGPPVGEIEAQADRGHDQGSEDGAAEDPRGRRRRPELEREGAQLLAEGGVGRGLEGAERDEGGDEERGVDDDAAEQPGQTHGGDPLPGNEDS